MEKKCMKATKMINSMVQYDLQGGCSSAHGLSKVGKEKLYSDYTLATSTPYCPTSYAYCYGITTQYVQTRILDMNVHR
jgi:hypothetical protein